MVCETQNIQILKEKGKNDDNEKSDLKSSNIKGT